MKKKIIKCEVRKLTWTPHSSVLFMCWEQSGTLSGSGCTLWKLPDTLMTRNAELSTYVLLGVLCLIHITVIQKLIPKWSIMNLKNTSGSTKALQDICWFSWSCVRPQSFIPSLNTQSFPMAANICAIDLTPTLWNQEIHFPTCGTCAPLPGHTQWISYLKIW